MADGRFAPVTGRARTSRRCPSILGQWVTLYPLLFVTFSFTRFITLATYSMCPFVSTPRGMAKRANSNVRAAISPVSASTVFRGKGMATAFTQPSRQRSLVKATPGGDHPQPDEHAEGLVVPDDHCANLLSGWVHSSYACFCRRISRCALRDR